MTKLAVQFTTRLVSGDRQSDRPRHPTGYDSFYEHINSRIAGHRSSGCHWETAEASTLLDKRDLAGLDFSNIPEKYYGFHDEYKRFSMFLSWIFINIGNIGPKFIVKTTCYRLSETRY